MRKSHVATATHIVFLKTDLQKHAANSTFHVFIRGAVVKKSHAAIALLKKTHADFEHLFP